MLTYFGPKILVWYDRSVKSWVATYRDEVSNQVGHCGYGNTKQEAIDDVKYQNPVYLKDEQDS